MVSGNKKKSVGEKAEKFKVAASKQGKTDLAGEMNVRTGKTKCGLYFCKCEVIGFLKMIGGKDGKIDS